MDHHLLERMLLDPSAEPTNLPISLLKSITNGFSDDEKIGSGGFAVVYRGELRSGTIIAVKKLFNTPDMDEEKFIKEVGCLMKAKHKNIVRFLGYCSDTQGKILNHEGKMIHAEERQRLLCFEFQPKGSLDKYITDISEGLEWRTRYKIVKGICKGLHYLHHDNGIVHSDLKPANILLDEDMVPKISDFGLARCFDGNQSKTMTSKVIGTVGYLAPESYGGVITFKSDIYSLGIIIMEILTGLKGYCNTQNVLQSWSIRLKPSQEDILLEHVRVCAEIGNQCIAANPADRPDTPYIIERLDEIEHTCGFIETDISPSVPQVHWTAVCRGDPSSPWKTIELFKGVTAHRVLLKSTPATPSPLQRVTVTGVLQATTQQGSETSNLLDVYPLELRFPLEPNKRTQCQVTLTNRTEHYVAAMITPVCQYTRSRVPSSSFHFRKMVPHSTDAILISIKEELVLSPQHIGNFQVLMVILASEDGFSSLESFIHRNSKMAMDSNFLNGVEESWGEVHQAMLTAIVCDPASFPPVVTRRQFTDYEAVCDVPGQPKLGSAKFVDVHPTEAWMLVGHRGGYVSIWNFQTQERIMALLVTTNSPATVTATVVCSVKFIAREGWLLAGDEEGYVHVYDYTTAEKVTEFKAYDSHDVYSLAVHPTGSLLLTAAYMERRIKLWDWAQGWECTRTFEHWGAFYLRWNPRDTNTFASSDCSDDRDSYSFKVKIWNIQSSNPITTLDGSSCVDYLYTESTNRHFVLTDDRRAHGDLDYVRIWDLQTKGCIHKLGIRHQTIHGIACHSTLPLFVTPTTYNNLCLWDAKTYRLETIVGTNYIEHVAFVDSKDTTRLLVKCNKGVEIMEINMSMARTGRLEDWWWDQGC